VGGAKLRRRRREGGGGNTALITAADITYLGCMRMPSTVVDTENGGVGAVAGRVVGGQLRLFVYGKNTTNRQATITSGGSTTQFVTGSSFGSGSEFLPGEKVAVVRAANGTNLPEPCTVVSYGAGTMVVTPALGGTPANGDVVYRENDYWIYELADTGTGTYTTDYTQAPHMTLVTAWPDIYNGRRVTWRNGVLTAPMQYTYGAGLYWHEGTQLLYWGYYDAYNGSTNNPDWCMGASSLDNPTTGATTSYGPWRSRVVDRDGVTWYGAARGGRFTQLPDGSMGTWGSPFGQTEASFGPALFGGAAWPTTATPGGLAGSDLVGVDRYINHYYMGDTLAQNHFNENGQLTGTCRSFKYPTSPNRNYVYESYLADNSWADPAQTGFCTWVSNDTVTGVTWLEGASKRGALFLATIVGGTTQDTSSVTAAHYFYANSGQVYFLLTNVTGTFQLGETVTGQTSGKTAQVSSGAAGPYWTPATGFLAAFQIDTAHTNDFTVGEVIVGGTSGAQGTIGTFHRADTCNHGFGPPDVPQIAGPITTAGFPALIVYDTADLVTSAASDSPNDYAIVPSSWIDLATTFGIKVLGRGGLRSFTVYGSYWDSTRNYLFLAAAEADDSTTFGAHYALIHVFHINID
jgi:hypothetical protein